jgi:predicted MFS family arabinose efflux permease
MLDGIKYVIHNPQIIMIAIFGFCMYMPMTVFADAWGIPFVMKAFSVSRGEAASCVSKIHIGIIFGAPIYGFMATKYTNYKIYFTFMSLICCVLYTMVIWNKDITIDFLHLIFLTIGVITSGQMLKFAAATAGSPVKYSGSIVGFVNMCTMASGALFQKGVGLILDMTWDGQKNNLGIAVYSADNYRWALTTISITLGISCICSLMIKKR